MVMLLLGFSAGLPFLLVFDTLSAWLRSAGLTLAVIGYFSLATLDAVFASEGGPESLSEALDDLCRRKTRPCRSAYRLT